MAQAATLTVDLVACTHLTDTVHEYLSPHIATTDADHLAEFAGRACYRSFSRPNPATRQNPDYLRNILEQGHESVLSHASATFYISGVSRTLTHELVRHRWFSFSELSQRYVDPELFEMVIPPGMVGVEDLVEQLEFDFDQGMRHAEVAYRYLIATGNYTAKQARQAARAFLPNCTATEIVATSNLRGWRDFIKQRNSPHADAEIQLLAHAILDQLDALAPNTMQDLT